ncbi:MAG: isoprenylcysteine carboxylmethyltransferase family protein [Spirochaetales bacterium]|nr:isoprenylcysteine carboxylmethyltransferase family protein [Spirochaetales bacterium]
MHLKGFDKFVEKVPYLSGKKIVFVFLYVLVIGAIEFVILTVFYRLPGILMNTGVNEAVLAFFPAAGVLCIGAAGFILVYQMWRQRGRLRKKYGAGSYRRILPVGLAGIILIIMLSFYQFVPFFDFSPAFWAASRFDFLAVPLDSLAGPAAPVFFAVKCVFAFPLLGLGIATAVRALLTFGFDYMTVVYLYFPEESEIQNNRIYSVIRHPAYGAAIVMNLAGTLFTLTLLSLVSFILFVLGFWIHLRFVEEKELLERFGKQYREYMKQVPAFFPRPKDFGVLFGFLAGR